MSSFASAAAIVLIACLAALAPATAGAATGGSISGTVTGADTKAPLEAIEACATAHETASKATCTKTDAEGKYTIAELAAGEYDVEFRLAEGSKLNYLSQLYAGNPVTVVEGVETPPVDAELAVGGEVQGLLTEGEGKPVQGMEVCAESLQVVGGQQRCTQTGAGGEYVIAGLGSDEYDVRFSVPLGSQLEYAQQFYKGATTRALATPVPVTAGETAKAIDAVLAAGGTIEGTVSSALTKAPVAGVLVCAKSSVAEQDPCATTEAAGRYALKRLAAGSYKVRFVPGEGAPLYLEQFFDGKAHEAEADPIEVLAGGAVAEVDAGLVEAPAEEPEEKPTEKPTEEKPAEEKPAGEKPAGEEPAKEKPAEEAPKAGPPTAVLKPAIVGAAVEGQTLTMLRGTWGNSPTSITDEWGRCDGSGVIATCFTVATTPTYTLTAADVGHTIRIREKAANALGEAQMFSPPSAVVVKPAPPAVTGVLAATAKGATTAQLKALLARVLLPRGSSAKLAALVKHHGYSISFSSIAAGRLSVAWYQVAKGAHLSTHVKPLLVASGKVTMKESGVAKLTIKLTAKGRRLLSAAKQPLELTAKGVLAPSGAGSLRATHAFTVKR